ncbi:hypothetical protein [Pontibacillus marinus]|uniref:Uncharacterized protein n=1 Tax=Pontibacillus marinus BH030004 = DSM 16465 TaxID=1385511 RepID=A0A0A5GFB9_9BACI|nr:hypothetical protein [Pontibacillus marinus]KGX89820.1 hypothetical protein N783_04225 [Pontibacillus marinus BH030004 = DSM 16465]
MKSFFIVFGTIFFEFLLILVIATFLGVQVMEVLFLGGAFIFGVIWLSGIEMNRVNNIAKAGTKGWTGLDAGQVKLFRFEITPIMFGLILFLIISLIITLIYYAPYFMA